MSDVGGSDRDVGDPLRDKYANQSSNPPPPLNSLHKQAATSEWRSIGVDGRMDEWMGG